MFLTGSVICVYKACENLNVTLQKEFPFSSHYSYFYKSFDLHNKAMEIRLH